MGFALTIDEGRFRKLQENYRRAFRVFAQASEELTVIQQAECVNLSQIHEADVRIRDAQAACREARDKLACFLLETRRQRLLQPWTAVPARLELLTFVSRIIPLLSNEHDSNTNIQFRRTDRGFKANAPRLNAALHQ